MRGVDGYAEIRYHKRVTTIIEAGNGTGQGRAEDSWREPRSDAHDGCWGFVSTSDVTESGLCSALADAIDGAAAAARDKE